MDEDILGALFAVRAIEKSFTKLDMELNELSAAYPFPKRANSRFKALRRLKACSSCSQCMRKAC